MKKLKLNLKDVGEILTRDQLKQVFGGSGGGGCTYSYCHCFSEPGAWTGCYSSSEERRAAVRTYCGSEAGFCN